MVTPCNVLKFLVIVGFHFLVYYGVMCSPEYTAMFVFGDSLIDDGNNNNINTFAKSNYYPYGIDFKGGPTGRFCNGKTIIDFLGDLIGLPPIPAFTLINTTRDSIDGVNYASAAAGILDETGKLFGERHSLSAQVRNFRSTLTQLKSQMNETDLAKYLSESLAVLSHGSNDYINNYLVPAAYSSSYLYNPKDFTDLLIKNYTMQILALRDLGLRKFLLAGVGPLGCIPNQLASGLATPGKCVTYVNTMVEYFDEKLKSLIDELNKNHSDSVFVYGNTYGVFNDILDNPASYGFRVTDRGCCGVGRNRGQVTCLPVVIPCANRDEYIFWDAFHPTQAFNKIMAQRAYDGPPSDCYPINVKQMSQV